MSVLPSNLVESISELLSSSSYTPLGLSSQHALPSQQHPQLPQGPMPIIVPTWQPDEQAESCFNCGKKFSFWIRKHHCRKCGRVVCNSCSMNEITYLPSTYVVTPPTQIFLESPHIVHRTCDPCYEEIEMIRSALNDSLVLNQHSNDDSSTSSKDLSSSSVTTTTTMDIPGNRRGSSDDDSFKNRCPVCNKFVGCYAEQQKEEHINECLVNLEFSGSPQQHRTNNRMLVYKIPKNLGGISIPAIENNSNNVDTGSNVPSTSMDTLTSRSDASESNVGSITNNNNTMGDHISSSHRSNTSTLNVVVAENEKYDEQDERECVICFEEFEPGDKVARMECLCVFHYKCIKDWFKKKGARECPVHTLHYN